MSIQPLGNSPIKPDTKIPKPSSPQERVIEPSSQKREWTKTEKMFKEIQKATIKESKKEIKALFGTSSAELQEILKVSSQGMQG